MSFRLCHQRERGSLDSPARSNEAAGPAPSGDALWTGHEANAAGVDQPIAGLLTNLKQRDLLKDSLVIWAAENKVYRSARV